MVLGVAHHDAFEDDVVVDLLVGGVGLAELLERDLPSEGLLRGALQEVEFDGDGLVPAVGEGERHGCRTRNFVGGVRLGRDDQTALFALGIHDFEVLDPVGVVGFGISMSTVIASKGDVGLDRRGVLAAAGSGDGDGRPRELDLRVNERLLLDIERIAARIHVGAEHEARFALEAFVEFAFGRDGTLPVNRFTAGQADPVGLADALDMEGAVGVDVDVERVRIGFDDELLLQCAQFDQGARSSASSTLQAAEAAHTAAMPKNLNIDLRQFIFYTFYSLMFFGRARRTVHPPRSRNSFSYNVP